MAQQSSDEQKQHNALSGQGVFKWEVTGDLLTQFKNAKHKQKFYSPPFKTIDGTIWKIRFYPRGDQSPEYCKIYLKCDTLCANKARIGVNYSFNIRELDWSYDMGETFRYDGATSGPPNPFKPQVLNDLSTLTIECAVEETMNVSEGTSYFEWNVTNRLLRQWKEAKYKQVFFSPRFDAIGGVWYFGIYPNGKTTEGEAYLYIWCQSLTSDQMNVCHVTQSNNSQMHLDGHTIKKGGSFACKSPFQHKNILNEASVTIGTKLFAKESIDNAEARFISKLYANKAQSPKEWTEYFITESNRAMALLSRLGLGHYGSILAANACFTMKQLRDSVCDLKGIGVKAQGARKRIVAGVNAHYSIAHKTRSHAQSNQRDVDSKESLEEETLKAGITQSEHGFIQWKITGDLLNQFKNAKYKKLFWSPTFKAIGGEWYFRIYPNGWSQEGVAALDIVCEAIESDVNHVHVCHFVESVTLNYSQVHLDGNSVEEDEAVECESPCKHKEIQNKSSITFGIRLWANKSIDKAESQFLSGLYSQSPKEWREYFITRTNRVTTLLSAVGMEQYAAVFKDNEYKTMQHLRDLSHKDLEEMRVSVGAHRKAILDGITSYFTSKQKKKKNTSHSKQANKPTASYPPQYTHETDTMRTLKPQPFARYAHVEEDEKVAAKEMPLNSFKSELNQLLHVIDSHMQFMKTHEKNVNKIIASSGNHASLLTTAKSTALATEKEILNQIMNITTMNQFLNDIILVENLFNSEYTADQRDKQRNARQQYASTIPNYESKPKPRSKADSFVDLVFYAKSTLGSFKKWLQKLTKECAQQKIRIVSNSGAKEKNIERAFYKSFYVYGAVMGEYGYVQMTDVLRCSLVFDDFKHLYRCFAVIETMLKDNSDGGILRCKDRFDPKDIAFGYRDLLINMHCPGSNKKVICEVQLHH
eukprot:413944_1